MIERQGKSFALYQGLLNEAHEQGLTSIETSLLQIPNKDNSFVAIASATVTMGRGDEARRFSAIGDASPANVSQQMQSAIIRMAETRAKARAIRDAVNIGVAAAEELPGDEYHGGVVREPDPRYANRPVYKPTPLPKEEGESPAALKNQIKERIKRMGGPEDSKGQAAVMLGILGGTPPPKWDRNAFQAILDAPLTEWNKAVDSYLLTLAQAQEAVKTEEEEKAA